MKLRLSSIVASILLLAAPAALASFHTFLIEQIYSNADGTVQFVVMHESIGLNGESAWTGNALTISQGSTMKSMVFPNDLPGGNYDVYGGMMASPTANKRVLIATQGFAALGIVPPDYVMPNGFLPMNGGTLNYAGTDAVTYPPLPTDGVNALQIVRGTTVTANVVPNVATNFVGRSGSVAPAAAATDFVPVDGVWANAAESGRGFALGFKHGVLIVAIYAYLPDGTAEWYLASGPVVNNVFTATLDKYAGGQCVSCAYAGPPTVTGNDGALTITFTSNTSATVNFPGGRVTQIAPFQF